MGFFELVVLIVPLAYTVLWVLAMVHCAQHEPDRAFWLVVLILLPFPGVLIYLALRWAPNSRGSMPSGLLRWTRQRSLRRLEIAAKQIGNPYQYVQWGDALQEVGQLDQAAAAYAKALAKEAGNLPALWGSAVVASKQRRWAEAESFAQSTLSRDANYKFGDTSCLLGVALAEQGRVVEAREHFEQHIRRWRQPEAMYTLAALSQLSGDDTAARSHATALLTDLEVSPKGIASKHRAWQRKARQLLRQLGPET